MSEFFQQVEILHIPRADLYDIHVFKKRKMICIHDFRNDRHTGNFFCFQEIFDSVRFQSLEIIRRGSRLEGAAS